MNTLTFVSAANPRWMDAAQTMIDIDLVFSDGGPKIPYTCSGSDPVSQTLFADAKAGKYGNVSAYSVPAISPAQLQIAAAVARQKIADGGLTVNAGTAASPVNVSVDTSAAGRTDLNGLANIAATNTAFTAVWVQSSGNITLNSAQILTVAAAVAAFIAGTFVTFGEIVTAIQNGTITTLAQINTPPASIQAWPKNS